MGKDRFLCDDFLRAKQNRRMVSRKLHTWAYVQVENWLAANPSGYLPDWVFTDGFIYTSKESGSKGGLARAKSLTSKRKKEIWYR